MKHEERNEVATRIAKKLTSTSVWEKFEEWAPEGRESNQELLAYRRFQGQLVFLLCVESTGEVGNRNVDLWWSSAAQSADSERKRESAKASGLCLAEAYNRREPKLMRIIAALLESHEIAQSCNELWELGIARISNTNDRTWEFLSREGFYRIIKATSEGTGTLSIAQKSKGGSLDRKRSRPSKDFIPGRKSMRISGRKRNYNEQDYDEEELEQEEIEKQEEKVKESKKAKVARKNKAQKKTKKKLLQQKREEEKARSLQTKGTQSEEKISQAVEIDQDHSDHTTEHESIVDDEYADGLMRATNTADIHVSVVDARDEFFSTIGPYINQIRDMNDMHAAYWARSSSTVYPGMQDTYFTNVDRTRKTVKIAVERVVRFMGLVDSEYNPVENPDTELAKQYHKLFKVTWLDAVSAVVRLDRAHAVCHWKMIWASRNDLIRIARSLDVECLDGRNLWRDIINPMGRHGLFKGSISKNFLTLFRYCESQAKLGDSASMQFVNGLTPLFKPQLPERVIDKIASILASNLIGDVNIQIRLARLVETHRASLEQDFPQQTDLLLEEDEIPWLSASNLIV